MWHTYGKEGVAIGTTIESLSSALKTTSYDFTFGKMCYFKRFGKYARCSNAEKEQFLLQAHFLKREEYQSENEVRLVTCASERESGGLLLSDIKPGTWIKNLRLWPALTSQDEDSITKAVVGQLPNVRCSKSDLLQTHGKAAARLFEDLSSRAVASSQRNWNNGNDGVPDLLKKP